jgi:FkbM family methyltransferase
VLRSVGETRRAFENWLEIAVVGGISSRSRLRPRGAGGRLGERRLAARTREGFTLETAANNLSPIVEVFRNGVYALPLDWTSLRTIVDLGAHVGSFSVWAAGRAPAATILALEPEPRNFEDLVRNIERNGLAGRVTPIHAAAGAGDGIATIGVPLLRDTVSADAAAHAPTVEVPRVDIERLLADAPAPVDLLKVDCEGAEWSIAERLTEATWSRIRHVVVEAHGGVDRDPAEMEGILRGHGLETTTLARGEVAEPWLGRTAEIFAWRR